MNRFRAPTILGTLVLGATVSAFAAGIGETVFIADQWSVHRAADAMTDKIVCTGVHAKSGAQVVGLHFYVPIQGGLQTVQLRFDDDPPLPMRDPSKLEREIRAVVFTPSEVNAAFNAKRVRVEALTLIAGVQTKDISLVGLPEARQNMSAGCPTASATPGSSAAIPRGSDCTASLIDRMLKQGMTAQQIAGVCPASSEK